MVNRLVSKALCRLSRQSCALVLLASASASLAGGQAILISTSVDNETIIDQASFSGKLENGKNFEFEFTIGEESAVNNLQVSYSIKGYKSRKVDINYPFEEVHLTSVDINGRGSPKETTFSISIEVGPSTECFENSSGRSKLILEIYKGEPSSLYLLDTSSCLVERKELEF